ncbi:hypothetical protein TNCT_486111 [Trichonephila clavata]|uniref:Uncharacterized protein n=1 Tax=Trichonephila clavata TaxID=2740835 RepID=A0A8X6HAF5_TRICU|nr:hypothetical protein TNCT_486111 [Trichonephila clavata]
MPIHSWQSRSHPSPELLRVNRRVGVSSHGYWGRPSCRTNTSHANDSLPSVYTSSSPLKKFHGGVHLLLDSSIGLSGPHPVPGRIGMSDVIP